VKSGDETAHETANDRLNVLFSWRSIKRCWTSRWVTSSAVARRRRCRTIYITRYTRCS